MRHNAGNGAEPPIMRKLFLASFEFKTGKLKFKEYRLVVLHAKEGESEQSQLDGAYEVAHMGFSNGFPESSLISLVVHPAFE